MELYNPAVIRFLKKEYGFRFAKSLGQNFLTDRSILEAITAGAELSKDDLVIEIGPGIGTLTQQAAEEAGQVIAVEVDRNLITIARDTLADYPNVEIVEGDILKTDLSELIARRPGWKHVKIIGNLPYYITTPIVTKLVRERMRAESITVMMQKEVADRIQAGPGTKAYGALTIAVQFYSDVRHVVDVPKECFVPVPKVDSCVLRMDIRRIPAVEVKDEDMMFRCVRAAFGQRRKTLLNSLGGIGVSKELICACLEDAGIDGSRRAETLSMQEFAKLSDAFTAATQD